MCSSTIILAFATFGFILCQINAVDVSFNWCRRTDVISFCLQMINPDLRNDLKSSPEGLCRILVDKALAVSEVTMGKISNLIKDSTGTNNQVLRDCLNGYNQAHDVLQQVNLSVLDPQTYHNVAAAVSFPYHKADECEQEFKQLLPSSPSPLTPENKYLEHIIRVAMEIINLKVCNHRGICGYKFVLN